MELQRLADFLFEVGILQKTPRTGYRFLGSGDQSVAEHLFRTALIGYCLAKMEGNADVLKTVLMCLIHDIGESRTGDQNYVYKRYVQAKEEEALEDALKDTGLGEILELFKEFKEGKTLEARLSHDADQLELILELKEQKDLGNPYAEEWLKYALKRLKTQTGLKLAKAVLERHFCDWWFDRKEERWWVEGK